MHSRPKAGVPGFLQVLHHLLEVRNCEQCYPALAFSFFGFVGRDRSESVDRVESCKFGHVRQVANLRLKIGIGVKKRRSVAGVELTVGTEIAEQLTSTPSDNPVPSFSAVKAAKSVDSDHR